MGKRYSFQWINGQIISAADHGGLDNLLEVVANHLEHMNLVNLSTAIHRLAKLSSRDLVGQAKLLKQAVMKGLLEAIESAFGNLEVGEAQPQSLSNVAWSLATMRLAPRNLIQVMANLAVTNIPAFKPFELSTMLWAFAKLSTADGAGSGANCCIKPVFHASGAHILNNAHNFAFRCLATTAWAFATARQNNARLFRTIATQMVPMVHAANCQEMANTAWAFGTTDFHDERLFNELAKQALIKLSDFKPQELSNMLWGFATNGFFHEAFYSAAAAMATSHMELQAQHLANILWSFTRVRPRHPVTQETVLALLPCCVEQMESFKPQEASSTALAVAKAFRRGDMGEALEGPMAFPDDQGHFPAVTGQGDLPCEVHEFFSVMIRWSVRHLHEFSVQSLANTVSAFTLIETPGVEVLFSAIANEVRSRYDTLEPTSLMHLLKGFSSTPSCRSLVNALAAGLAPRVDKLRPQELQVLSRICCGLLGLTINRTPTIEELRGWCMQLGSPDVPVVKEVLWMHKDSGNDSFHEDDYDSLESFELGDMPTSVGLPNPAQFATDPICDGRVKNFGQKKEGRSIRNVALTQELQLILKNKRGRGGRPEEPKDEKQHLFSINESKQSGQNTNKQAAMAKQNEVSENYIKDLLRIPRNAETKDMKDGGDSGANKCPSPSGDPRTFRWSVKNTFLTIQEVFADGECDDNKSEAETMEGSYDGDASQRSSSVPSRLDHEDWVHLDKDLKDMIRPVAVRARGRARQARQHLQLQ